MSLTLSASFRSYNLRVGYFFSQSDVFALTPCTSPLAFFSVLGELKRTSPESPDPDSSPFFSAH